MPRQIKIEDANNVSVYLCNLSAFMLYRVPTRITPSTTLPIGWMSRNEFHDLQVHRRTFCEVRFTLFGSVK